MLERPDPTRAKTPRPRGDDARDIAGALARHTLPIIGSNVLGLVLNVSELYYAGLIGPEALTGVAVAATATTFIQSLALASFTSGVTREVTIRNVQGGPVRDMVRTVLISGVAAGLAAALGCGLGGTTMLRGMGLDGRSLEEGAAFLRAVSIGFPCLFVLAAFQGLLRGLGDARVPARVMAVVATLSLVLGPALALPWGLGLGAVGLGLGTAGAFTLGAWTALGVLRQRLEVAPLALRVGVPFDGALLLCVTRVGVPSALVWLVVALTMALLQRLMSSLGEDFLVAVSLVLRLEPIGGMVASAFAAAALHVIGRYHAVGDTGRALTALRLQQGMLVATLAPFVLFLEAWPRAWVSLFTTNQTVLRVATINTRYLAAALPLVGSAQLIGAAFYAFGRATAGLRIVAVKNLLLTLPALFVLVWCLGVHDLHALFLTQAAAGLVTWLYSERLLRQWSPIA